MMNFHSHVKDSFGRRKPLRATLLACAVLAAPASGGPGAASGSGAGDLGELLAAADLLAGSGPPLPDNARVPNEDDDAERRRLQLQMYTGQQSMGLLGPDITVSPLGSPLYRIGEVCDPRVSFYAHNGDSKRGPID